MYDNRGDTGYPTLTLISAPEEYKKMVKHVGFNGAVSSVEKKEGFSKEKAEKIIAAGARNASPTTKKSNPRLKRVKG